jgi:hypothetical protein
VKFIGAVLTVLGVILLIGLCVFAIVRAYHFDRNCGDYLKLAGDAPTITRANDFLKKAIAYLKETGKTSGDSAFIFKHKPTNDIAIWYQQLIAAENTTEEILVKGDAATQLEKDNALMKIRETILDQGEGVSVTHPTNISFYPRQGAFYRWLILSIVLAVAGFIVWFIGMLRN